MIRHDQSGAGYITQQHTYCFSDIRSYWNITAVINTTTAGAPVIIKKRNQGANKKKLLTNKFVVISL